MDAVGVAHPHRGAAQHTHHAATTRGPALSFKPAAPKKPVGTASPNHAHKPVLPALPKAGPHLSPQAHSCPGQLFGNGMASHHVAARNRCAK